MIAIKDMKMPKSCGECLRTEMCSTYLNQYVYHPSTRYSYGQDKRPNDCPLVEIVTCKNCNHHEDIVAALHKDGTKKILHVCKKHEMGVSEDFFCKDGERGEET
jgi:hypothetical protein